LADDGGTEKTTETRRRVLIVDDNRDAADTLRVLLRLRGHEVQVAYDGVSALARAQEFHPEVVFLDIGMPGMDGYEVARRLREQHMTEKMVLVAVTGWGQDEDRQRAQQAGFDGAYSQAAQPDSIVSLLRSP
jgi:CheY-like chemotaxis protein